MCYSIMSSLNTLFRENFKKCCKEKGYTQQEVADKLGISLDGLKHHLRKNNPYLPSVDLLYKMAKIFDVDISYLIGEINSPKCSMQAISEITGINDRSISLITRNTSQFMPGFCFLINAISKSGHLEEFSSLIEEFRNISKHQFFRTVHVFFIKSQIYQSLDYGYYFSIKRYRILITL